MTAFDACLFPSGCDVGKILAGQRCLQALQYLENVVPFPLPLRELTGGEVGTSFCVGTSPTVFDQRTGPGYRRRPALSRDPFLAWSASDQVREILAALSLNKSRLAKLMLVSRRTLYDWLEGTEPNQINSDRLASLLRILHRAGVSSRSPLNARFVRQPLEEHGISLLDALLQDLWDEEVLLDLIRSARVLGEAAASRRGRREGRLEALGYEKPSQEQRRERLARNTALLDWPGK